MNEPEPQPSLASESPQRFDRFSQRARAVFTLAQEEAERFNHNYIGTEHLLLGLIRESEGVAAKVLTDLGIKLDKVRSAIEFTVGRGSQAPSGERSMTPRAKRVIELAVTEARDLGHHYIGTEHLLLGLVREGEGIAAGTLESLGLTLNKVRRATLRVLNQQGALSSRRATDSGPTKDNVVTCRIDDDDLAAIDTLIEAGIRSTRSDAAAWFVHAGVQAQAALLTRVNDTVSQIRRLRQDAQTMAQEHATDDTAPPAAATPAPERPAE